MLGKEGISIPSFWKNQESCSCCQLRSW